MVTSISARLRIIASYCPPGARVADIGSDHALLASWLLQNGIASQVIAGELNEGPYEAARKQLQPWIREERAFVRRGDGLDVLAPGEADVIVVAGMGGQLIASILERGREKLAGVRRLILQPNVGEEQVRRWLLDNGWQLCDETALEEDGICYEILVAEPGSPLAPYEGQDRTLEELLLLGPHLWAKKHPVLQRKWERERDKRQKILAQLARSDRHEARERMEQIRKELAWVEEVLTCLRTDKP